MIKRLLEAPKDKAKRKEYIKKCRGHKQNRYLVKISGKIPSRYWYSNLEGEEVVVCESDRGYVFAEDLDRGVSVPQRYIEERHIKQIGQLKVGYKYDILVEGVVFMEAVITDVIRHKWDDELYVGFFMNFYGRAFTGVWDKKGNCLSCSASEKYDLYVNSAKQVVHDENGKIVYGDLEYSYRKR